MSMKTTISQRLQMAEAKWVHCETPIDNDQCKFFIFNQYSQQICIWNMWHVTTINIKFCSMCHGCVFSHFPKFGCIYQVDVVKHITFTNIKFCSRCHGCVFGHIPKFGCISQVDDDVKV